jgi:predicted alpha/beta-fold hydrolase
LHGKHFTKLLCQQLRDQPRLLADSALERPSRLPRTLREFDELFTAPKSGFASADEYYTRSSASQFVPRIRVPTLILASRDDPLVPLAPFESLDLSPAVTLHIADSGGHLGYIARGGIDPDRRWMDWRVVDWMTAAGV